jgi:uncharacterized Zn-binding protein involved in type VI secretion
MFAVARVGDTASHGGSLASGSPNTNCNGVAVCRIGDIYNCPTHGANPIISGSTVTLVNGAGIARVGDSTSCGAVITSGSPNVASS